MECGLSPFLTDVEVLGESSFSSLVTVSVKSLSIIAWIQIGFEFSSELKGINHTEGI